jgi:hypothetical protein
MTTRPTGGGARTPAPQPDYDSPPRRRRGYQRESLSEAMIKSFIRSIGHPLTDAPSDRTAEPLSILEYGREPDPLPRRAEGAPLNVGRGSGWGEPRPSMFWNPLSLLHKGGGNVADSASPNFQWPVSS